MEIEESIHPSIVEDRVTTRRWELDLSLLDDLAPLHIRPKRRKRQQIARFSGRNGTTEIFSIRQTIPYCGHEAESHPTQAQYGAVLDFFCEPCETRYQASTLLSARDYAKSVSDTFRFKEPRNHLLSVSIAAFILSDKDLRSLVRTWYVVQSRHGTTGNSGSATYRRAHRKIVKYAERFVDDMRAEGADIFN